MCGGVSQRKLNDAAASDSFSPSPKGLFVNTDNFTAPSRRLVHLSVRVFTHKYKFRGVRVFIHRCV